MITALETFQAAEKYLCEGTYSHNLKFKHQVNNLICCLGLMKACVTYLNSQLTVENVLQIYQRIRVYLPANFDQPSAPSLEEIDIVEPSSFNIFLDHQSIKNQARLNWCSHLMNNCLEFIEINASTVLGSEVRTYEISFSTSTTL